MNDYTKGQQDLIQSIKKEMLEIIDKEGDELLVDIFSLFITLKPLEK